MSFIFYLFYNVDIIKYFNTFESQCEKYVNDISFLIITNIFEKCNEISIKLYDSHTIK